MLKTCQSCLAFKRTALYLERGHCPPLENSCLACYRFGRLRRGVIMERNLATEAVGKPTLAAIVYGLYLAGFFTGLTALIGVIIAYIQRPAASRLIETHHTFQIRTFWIGLAYIIIGAILSIVVVGYLILLWWVIWTLVRSVKGLLLLNRGAPIANPKSWLWG